MMSALATASGVVSRPLPLKLGRSSFMRRSLWRDIPDAETTNWRAVCGKTARAVVCPAKAGMFSRSQTCRGKSQSPVVWIAEVMETETLKPIDKVSQGGIYESPGRNKSERVVASKVRSPEGRVFNRKTKAA
jgi:hypothetical protein